MRINAKLIFKGSSVDRRTKLISASLFRMKSAYRDFSKYLRRAILFIKQVERILPDWIARIYIDESVTESELEKLQLSHVEIVLYQCDEFWDSESGTHEGVFGTFMRFLPMFSAQKYECMVSSDVDLPDFWFESFKWFDSHAKEVGLINQSCHSSRIPQDVRYNILAGGLFSRIVFPRQLLTSFLKQAHERKIELKVLKDTDKDTYLPYGADEYFLNTKLYDYLEKHRVKILALTVTSVISEMKRIFKDNLSDSTIEPHMMKLEDLDRSLWKDPKNVNANEIKKHVRALSEFVEPDFQESFYKQCVTDFLEHPKTIRTYKYNY